MNYFRKRQNAFRYAFRGLLHLFRHEAHAAIHAVAALLVIIFAVLLHVNIYEWLALIICISLVIAMEAINSAVEKLTDIAAPDFSENAGRVKDMAAGAVLIVAMGSAIVGAIIFIPKIVAIF